MRPHVELPLRAQPPRPPKQGQKFDMVDVSALYTEILDAPDTPLVERRELLARSVLQHGIPDEVRPLVWKTLLHVGATSTDRYTRLLDAGLSKHKKNIYKDAHRTFKDDEDFQRVVTNSMLNRAINAVVVDLDLQYVQGMNVMCGPLLFVLNEVEAFAAFRNLCCICRGYLNPGIKGVYSGCKLVDEILDVVDPALARHLRADSSHLVVWAFGFIMTFGASVRPLRHALQLWDFFVAFGFHLVPLVLCMRVVCIRDDLLAQRKPTEALVRAVQQPFPIPRVIRLTTEGYGRLSPDLRERLAAHLSDVSRPQSLQDLMQKL